MRGTITALRFQKKNRDRVNVYLDGKYAFALPAVEAAKLGKGQELSEQQIADLRTANLRAKAYDSAVRYLASRPRSEWEVRGKLMRYRSRDGDRLSDTQIDSVVQKLEDRGYLSDDEFARYWVEQRNRFKPKSPRALRYELRKKGVDNRIIDTVVEEQANPAQAALDAARKRSTRYAHLDEDAFRQKMIPFLQRRGFRWSYVQDAVEQVWTELVQQAD